MRDARKTQIEELLFSEKCMHILTRDRILPPEKHRIGCDVVGVVPDIRLETEFREFPDPVEGRIHIEMRRVIKTVRGRRKQNAVSSVAYVFYGQIAIIFLDMLYDLDGNDKVVMAIKRFQY